MDFNTLKNSELVKRWVILISCIGILFFIVESIIAINTFNNVVDNLNLSELKSDLKDQNSRNNDDEKNIKQHMLIADKNLVKKSKEFDEAVNNFSEDFRKSFDDAMVRMKENDKYIDNAAEIHDQMFMKLLAEQQKSDEAFENNFKRVMMSQGHESREDEAKCRLKSKLIIRCEKKLYGYTTFNNKYPCDYDPFTNGLPKLCKADNKKDL
jgi:hypothetical protein